MGTVSPSLIRAIGRWTMVALVINMIVGSGIFGLPARVHAAAGVHGLLAYVGCGLVVGGIALCLAEVASRFTATGGPYLYAHTAFGPLPGFFIGWLMLLTRVTSAAIIAGIMADYVGFFWPGAAEGSTHAAVMVFGLILVALINVLGVRQGASFGAACTLAKLVPLVGFVVVGLFFIDPRRLGMETPPNPGSVTQAMLLLVFAFGGFESAVVTGGEMKDPRRDAPFALLVSVGSATLLYVLIQVVCIGTLPELASSKRPLADAAVRFAGPVGGGLLAMGALVSTLGTLGGTMLAAPRLLFAMAERGQMPDALAAVHPRFRTPIGAILLITGGGILLSVTGTFSFLVGLNVLTRLIQYLCTAIAVPVLRRRDRDAAPAFAVPLAWVTVPFTIAASTWLMVRSSPRELRDVGVALLVGLVFHGVQQLVSRGARTATETPPA